MEKAAHPPATPGWTKLLYSLGNIGTSITDRFMSMYLMAYYWPTSADHGLKPLVSSALVIGVIFFIGRALDTIFDPMVAFISDKCKSPRGRRMPFLLWGGLPLALSMTLLLFPPVNGVSWLNAVYLAFMLSAFYFFFSFYVCPFLALLPELARTPGERINLTSLQGLFTLLGVMLASMLAPILVASYGHKIMAVIMGVMAIITFYAPVIGVNEKKYCVAEPSSLNLKESIVSTLRNKPYVIYLIGNLSFWFGFNIITTCVYYYVTALMKLPEADMTVYMGIALVVSLIFLPVTNLLSRVMGNRNVTILSLVMFAVLLPLIYFFGDGHATAWAARLGLDFSSLPVINLGPIVLKLNSPELVFSYVVIAFAGIALSTLFIVPNAMVAELTDYDEKFTGLRREAIYFGTQGLFLKINLGISTLLNSLLFSLFGSTVQHPLGIRLTGPLGGLFAVVGIIAFLYYPKDLDAYAEKELQRRKTA